MSIRARSSRYLASSVVASGLSLVTLPLTTRILGPVDYGVFALGTTIAGVGAVVSTLGVTYVVASRWRDAGDEERAGMVTTIVALGVAIACLWSAAAIGADLALRSRLDFLHELPLDALALALGGTVLAPVWAVASDVLTIEGRAGSFSSVAVAQSVVTAAATLVALFAFDLGVLSLFAGLAAGAVVSCAAGVAVLAPYLRPRIDLRWRRELAQGSFGAAQALESAHPFLERLLLSRFAGLADLGLYTHSQRYRAIAFQASGAVNRAVWPVTLDEARDARLDFPTTRRTWAPLHVAVAVLGIGLAALGDRLVSLLTNGKFTDAAVYLGPWFVLLLLQLSAKPEVATVYALGRGQVAARVSLRANAVALVAAALLIPPFGTWGAVGALLAQALVYRVGVRVPARRLRPVPFQDHWALLGIALVLATFAAKTALDPGLEGSLVLFAAAEAALLVTAARMLGETTIRLIPRWRPAGS